MNTVSSFFLEGVWSIVLSRTQPLWMLLAPTRQEEATTTFWVDGWRFTSTGEGREDTGREISETGKDYIKEEIKEI